MLNITIIWLIVISLINFILTLSQPWMVHGLLGSWSLHWVNFKQPSDKVYEHVVIGSNPLLQGGFLGNQDMNLELFAIIALSLLSLGGVNSALTLLIFVWCFHVDEAFSRKEVTDKLALFHHVLWNGADNTDHSGK